jgi:hypothetical protein
MKFGIVKTIRKNFYDNVFWPITYYDYETKSIFIERFVDSNHDEKMDACKIVSGTYNSKLIAYVDLDHNDTHVAICYKQKCSTKNDLEFITKAKQSAFPTLVFDI